MREIRFDYRAQLLESVYRLAEMAFAEDMPDGDLTADILGLAGLNGEAQLICREPVYMCGALWYDQVVHAFRRQCPSLTLEVQALFADGQKAETGSTLFELKGNLAAILAVERTLLNFLTRAIGVANLTGRHVEAVRKYNPHTQVLDTRKTQPGYRWLDKYAVLCGGGQNHRLNLSTGVLIKENHIAKLAGVPQALQFVRERLTKDVDIEIEVRTMAELKQALAAECPIVMLDNFTPEMVREACSLPRKATLIEVSGGINLNNIGSYCHPQLDRISIGALTHSITAPDLSLLVREERL